MEEGRPQRNTIAWVSAVGTLLVGVAAVAALVIGGGDGDGNGGTDGPQYDPSRAEQRAAIEASSAARSVGINFSADQFIVDCEPSGSGGETQVWNCAATSSGGGQCSGTVVIALNSSGLASLRENSVGCGE